MVIVPVALLSSKARSIATGPCLTTRFFTTSVPFSSVVVSVTSPMGVLAASEATHAPSSSFTVR